MAIKHVYESDSGFPVKVWADDLDEGAKKQLLNVSLMPFIHHHVAVMPDAHIGLGCTIGTVIPTHKAIIPAAVGVDIGCGMMATKTNITAKDLPENLSGIRNSIERTIPLGPGKFHQKEYSLRKINNQFISQNMVNQFLRKDPDVMFGVTTRTWREQMGSLGGGNHFIEICLDEEDYVWVMLHSGSRGIGNKLGTIFIEKAKKDIKIHQANVPDKDLAYLSEGTQNFNDYVKAVAWAQEYASINRQVMMTLIFGQLEYYFPKIRFQQQLINCHHNYVEKEHHFEKNVWITRKGAIRAKEDDFGIIPGSMGAKSYIVKGKGNQESFHSCSHGAGRRMSRKQAFKKFTMDDLERQTLGVEMQRRKAIIDEIPEAYKDIDKVMKDQEDLVDVIHTLKQILNVKGD